MLPKVMRVKREGRAILLIGKVALIIVRVRAVLRMEKGGHIIIYKILVGANLRMKSPV